MDIQNGSKFTPYEVRAIVLNLKCREAPSDHARVTGRVEPGVYTIVDSVSGYGLLKEFEATRDGWINLQYVNKV